MLNGSTPNSPVRFDGELDDAVGDTGNLLLTVMEAASLLRISRSLAYQMTGEYLLSGGISGIPAISIGNCRRVPRWALVELATTGRVVRVCDVDAAE